MTMRLELPIRVVSEMNTREHWAVRNRRKQAQQTAVLAGWRQAFGHRRVPLPCVVRLTRIGCQPLDGDNLQAAFKGIRDQLARLIGVDDGSDKVRFEYAQEAVRKRQYAVRIEVQEA